MKATPNDDALKNKSSCRNSIQQQEVRAKWAPSGAALTVAGFLKGVDVVEEGGMCLEKLLYRRPESSSALKVIKSERKTKGKAKKLKQ